MIRFGYSYFFGKIFINVLDIYYDKIIYKNKYSFGYDDIAIIKLEDNTLSKFLGLSGFVITLKNGKSIRIGRNIKEYGNESKFSSCKENAYERLKNYFLSKCNNVEVFNISEFFIPFIISAIIQLPVLFILLFILKWNDFSSKFDLAIVITLLLNSLVVLYLLKKKKENKLKRILNANFKKN
ncbi:MAG: hypothetical protein QXD48_04070 [Candidatus Aenigmatarchaeota archaeon]